jgi:hypothetical protein
LYGPYGAQSRLQQSPQPLQTFPSMPPLQKLAPAGGAPQVPSVDPCAIVHTPPQQSGPCVQVSPLWMQNDDAIEHWPAAHSWEQQSELSVQSLPAVLQDALSAAHTPPVQVPPQHCAPNVQAWPSDVHAPIEHCPLTQDKEQHSKDVVHAVPGPWQLSGAPPRHELTRGSHSPEQQSASAPHWVPTAAQWFEPPVVALASTSPSLPCSEVVAELPPHPEPETRHAQAAASASRMQILKVVLTFLPMREWDKQGRGRSLRVTKDTGYRRARPDRGSRLVARSTTLAPLVTS